MGLKVTDRPTVAAEINKANARPAPGRISGSQAAANLAGMLAGVESGAPASAATSSLLGPVTAEKGASAGTADLGNQPFSSGALSVGDVTIGFGDTTLPDGLPPRKDGSWNSDFGRALGRTIEKMGDKAAENAQDLVKKANDTLDKDPKTREAAAKASVQSNGTKGSKSTVSDDPTKLKPLVTASMDAGVDVTKMPIEDAMVYMMMLCSNDARGDMEDMLKDMEKTRGKRAALRQAKQLMQEQQTEMKDALQEKYNNLSPDVKAKTTFDDFCKTEMVPLKPIVLDNINGTAFYGDENSMGTEDDSVQLVKGGVVKFSQVQTEVDNLGTEGDSLADQSQQQQLQMQMALDRMTKAETMASNISKKLADTLSSIISNFK